MGTTIDVDGSGNGRTSRLDGASTVMKLAKRAHPGALGRNRAKAEAKINASAGNHKETPVAEEMGHPSLDNVITQSGRLHIRLYSPTYRLFDESADTFAFSSVCR